MQNDRIIVEIKNVYGNELVYPICDDAKLFAAIASAKTLTLDTLQKIKSLGYAIIVKTRSL